MRSARSSSRGHDAVVQQRAEAKPGAHTLTEQWAQQVQLMADKPPPSGWPDATLQLEAAAPAPAGGLSAASEDAIHGVAADGVAAASAPLPFVDRIAESFGAEHAGTVHGIRAQVGGPAAAASDAMGAAAYATGSRVGFAGAPDLHTAAHEAAHVVQQQQGVHLKGGVGQVGDPYERHADAVADQVVRGESAAALLGPAGGDASVAVQHDKKDDAKPKAKADDGKEAQALAHLRKADTMLASLTKASAALVGKAQAKTADDKLIAQANALVGAAIPAEKELDDGQLVLREHYSDELQTRRGELPQVIKELREYPGMNDVVASLTDKLGHFFADFSTVYDLNEKAAGVLDPMRGKMFSSIKHLRGVLNLPDLDYAAMRSVGYATATVSAGVFNMHHQTPAERISNFAIQMAQSWDRSTGRFADSVGKFIETIDAEQFKKAEGGLVDALWDHAKELLEKGAEIVSGTALGAKIGIAAVEKLYAYEQEMEQQRQSDDKKAYVSALYTKIQELQTVGGDAGKPAQIQTNIDTMVDQFYAAGKTNADPSDAYNAGDQVAMGAQGDFLRQLEATAKAATDAVPTTSQFMAGFLADWVNYNHKERKSSMVRSPTAGSTHMDGYIEYDIALSVDRVGTFMLDLGEDAKLHCDKASNVADAMMNVFKPLTLRNSGCSLQINVTADSDARAKLPDVWGHDRTNTIRFYPGGMVESPKWTQEYWDFIQLKALRVGPSDLLEVAIKLSGD